MGRRSHSRRGRPAQQCPRTTERRCRVGGPGSRGKGTSINILLVELPTLLRDVVCRRLEQLSDARIGEIGLATLDLFARTPSDITAVVWAGSDNEAPWEPRRSLLAPCPGFRVLRLDERGETGVLFEMRRTTEILPDIGLDQLLEIAARDE